MFAPRVVDADEAVVLLDVTVSMRLFHGTRGHCQVVAWVLRILGRTAGLGQRLAATVRGGSAGPVRNFVFEAYSCPKENICLANRKPRRPNCRRFPPSC